MASYIYHCAVCAVDRTLSHSVHDDSQQLCPVCFTPMVRKPAVGGVQFKGSGFYRTDK